MNTLRKLLVGFAVSMIVVLPVLGREMSKIDFQADAPGQEAKAFRSIIGIWHIDKDGPKQVYAADGRKWEKGKLSQGAGDKAGELYGKKGGEFIRNIEAYGEFPLSVYKDIDNFSNGILSVSFKAISGKEDQAAGIAFNIRGNGTYLAVRANALENNLVLFSFAKGKRSSLLWIDNVPTAPHQWHTLKVVIRGNKVEGYIDEKKYIDYVHQENIGGRIGLWSKADSYMYFDSFIAQPM
jgi:hypothetical protein